MKIIRSNCTYYKYSNYEKEELMKIKPEIERNNYIFEFKYKNETRYLHFDIVAALESEAIEEVKNFIEYERELGKEVENGVLIKHIERKEIVWEMKI